MIDLSFEIEEFDDFIVGDYVDSYKISRSKHFPAINIIISIVVAQKLPGNSNKLVTILK